MKRRFIALLLSVVTLMTMLVFSACGEAESSDGSSGETTCECVDNDKNHLCDYCGEAVGIHEQASGKHICDYCGNTVSECEDNDGDYECDVCGKALEIPKNPNVETPGGSENIDLPDINV